MGWCMLAYVLENKESSWKKCSLGSYFFQALKLAGGRWEEGKRREWGRTKQIPKYIYFSGKKAHKALRLRTLAAAASSSKGKNGKRFPIKSRYSRNIFCFFVVSFCFWLKRNPVSYATPADNFSGKMGIIYGKLILQSSGSFWQNTGKLHKNGDWFY